MKDMEREGFENEWKNAFKQAEISPSDNVWMSIELDLERAEGERMRRKLFHYKLMAAASVAFALCFAGIGFYYFNGERKYASAELANNATLNNERNISSEEAVAQNSEKTYQIQKKESADNNGKRVDHLQNKMGIQQDLPSVVIQNKIRENSKTDKIQNSQGTSAAENEFEKEITKDISATDNALSYVTPVENNFDVEAKKVLAQRINNSNAPVSLQGNFNLSRDEKSLTNSPINSFAELNRKSLVPTKGSSLAESFTYRDLPVLVNIPTVEIQSREAPIDPFIAMMAALEKREAELAKDEEQPTSKKKGLTERLWTSLAFGAGNFNSSNSNVHPSSAVNSLSMAGNATSSTADNQSKASGTSYSAGLHVGTKVSERWVVQGGVNYISQVSAYQSDAVVGSNNLQSFRAASLNDLSASSSTANGKSNKLVGTSYYNVSNNAQYVSVPVQAGYLAINHAFAFQINAGVSTDLFIQNTITPEKSNNLEKVTQGRGDDSPYRSVNFSGLFGTEVSYRFGNHYRVALNPGLKYPINSIYKAETGVVSNPLTMDIAMRFKYIF